MSDNSNAHEGPSVGQKHSTAIELRDLHKYYGGVQAVNGLDLNITRGEVVAFLGPNGAGKTTTIDMILGLSDPTQGSVSVLSMPPRRAVSLGMVAAVMQTGGLLHDYTVLETLQFMASIYDKKSAIDAVMSRAGITHIANSLVKSCSGGEQQRLRFAMALLPEPELLILDEPTQGMDVEGRKQFWLSIKEDAALGRTVLFATHYLEEADNYADRIILIKKGSIVADGTPMEVKSLSSNKTVRAHISSLDKEALLNIQGVVSADLSHNKLEIVCHDSDLVAKYLLLETDAANLEISLAGLEETFLNLTTNQ
ncbi:MAG: ABC transporter ATP-binding protein [Firmicutes bacterium]|nr:ABC transporter ATP-binding protein [Bacillota bacterium]